MKARKRFVDLKINDNIYIVGKYSNEKPYITSRIVSFIKNINDNYNSDNYLLKLRIITAPPELSCDIDVDSFKSIFNSSKNEKIFSDKDIATNHFKKLLVDYLTYLDDEARFTRNKFGDLLSN